MNRSYSYLMAGLLALATTFTSCFKDNDFGGDGNMPGDIPGMGGDAGGTGGGTSSDDGNAPSFDPTISSWDGTLASDASLDAVGTDEDLFWEANSFTTEVKVTYDGTKATVTTSSKEVVSHTDGANVTLDLQTASVKNVNIIASGKSSDGQLKIYGNKKFKLTLNGLELTSKKGPAINSQCKKRIFVHLASGTTNALTDAATYSDDSYYLDAATAADEDRKGAFFSEGNLIFSGTGVLTVKGNYRHGIVTDGYLYVRPGVTIVVSGAAKNAIHVKGDADDNIGVVIAGGLVYTNTSSTAGKGIKCDMQVDVKGGKLLLNTSGNATYDADEKDTSSAACIKSDTDINISGGELTLKSTGTGGKGLNADGAINVSGGETTVTTTGGRYTYSSRLTASPKGVKADGDINISGGTLNISVTGKSEGSEGLESKATLNISGGAVYSYAYDDAINASKAINISGGRVYAYGSNNDGIDSNGTLVISGGLVIGVGTSSPESGIDCDQSSSFRINGGTVISVGGTLQTSPSSSSSQRTVVCNGVGMTKGKLLSVLDSSGKPILTFELPRTFSSGTFAFSSPSITSGAKLTLSSGGTLESATASWNGWSDGGTWSGGTSVASITASSTVTTTGGSNGGGMGGGGNRPW